MASTRPFLPVAALVALTLAFAYACGRFAWQPGLASFADDSASYLVMAQVLSLWGVPSTAISEAFVREAFYPPLFPLLLGMFGAGHDIALAHLMSALLIAAMLPLAYLLGVHWLRDRWAALAAVAVIALLPSLWIQAKAVLSEPLFSVFLLTALIADSRDRRGLVAIALAGVALTRSAGLVIVAAYGLHALLLTPGSRRDRVVAMWPAAAAGAAYAAWLLLRPAATGDDYVRILGERGQSVLANPQALAAMAASVGRQAGSLGEAWVGSLMLFWVEGRPVPVVIASLLGVLALAGMAWRLLRGRADAWMLAAYLATFLVWPFYDQMTRFIFPALPVLVLYALWTLGELARTLRRASAPSALFAALAFASLSGPALAFIHQRAGAPEPYVQIVEWYRTPDVARARLRSQVHLDLLADMDTIRRLTRPQDRVMWVAPTYLALLAERRGIPAPDAALPPIRYRALVEERKPDYFFLSLYHPRDTLSERSWQAGVAAMAGYGPVVNLTTRPDGAVTSMLLKLRADDLVAAHGRGPDG